MLSFQGNWVDLVFLALVLYFMLTNNGFVQTLLEATGFLFSLFASFALYGFFGRLLISSFTLPHGLGYALGFFVAWFLSELVFYLTVSHLSLRLFKAFLNHPLNKILGYGAGLIQASILFLFFVSLVFSFPVSGSVKQDILNSRSGPVFIGWSHTIEGGLKDVFGGAVNETINFLTIRPESGERVSLNFRVTSDKLSIDTGSEEIMVSLVNKERQRQALSKLRVDGTLQQTAREYGKQMFENGFFAHKSPVDGSSPSERADKAGVIYHIIGENLAYAPDVYIAHNGLMNSPGHRANILSSDYSRVGIGVVDAGIYGKMLVQEFAD